MDNTALKQAFAKAKSELIADGWEHVCTVMASDVALSYGSLWVKDSIRFYLNKDTLMPGFTGPQMALCCKPLFNKA